MGKKRNKKQSLKNTIQSLANRAIALNKRVSEQINKYKATGASIDNESYLSIVLDRIYKILNKKRFTKKDVELMRDFASKREYDYVKVNSQNLVDVNRASKKKASELNSALQTAVEIYPVKNTYYTNYLEPLMAHLVGDDDYEPQPGDENEYFKISPNYSGKRGELFKFVEFKQIPTQDNEAILFTEAIEELDWSSYDRYEKRMEDIAHRSYLSNLGLNEETITPVAITLEGLMNSSSAWHIASKNTDDSNQVKSNWNSLFYAVEEMTDKGDRSLIDEVLTMIDNEEDLDIILSTIDEGLTKTIKNK